MKRYLSVLAAAVAGVLTLWGQTGRPEFDPAPKVPAMPKALMKFPRTPIADHPREVPRSRFPPALRERGVIDHVEDTSRILAE